MQKLPEFIGRKEELEILDRFLKKTTASFIVLRSGIAPTKNTTAQSQRNEFAR